MASEGTFLLADIGGYTSFLSDVGLRHGKEITEHLLNRLVKSMGKPWKVANVMGDCVFFYAPASAAPAATFASVRGLYHAFRDGQLEVADGSTCRCGACDRTEELSLKFVVHTGEFDIQNIGGRKELIGQDIVLATRLLKNSVPVAEYLITTPATAAVADASGETSTPAQADLESLGPVDYSYVDLRHVREAYERDREFYVTAATAHLAVVEEIEAPAAILWDAIVDLTKRANWQVTIREMEHIQGQPGKVGEVHSCFHNDGTRIVHATIAVDEAGMRKTERLWVRPALMKDIYLTFCGEPLSPTRTRVAAYARFKPRIPIVSHLARPIFVARMKANIRKDMAGLKELGETGTVASRVPAIAPNS